MSAMPASVDFSAQPIRPLPTPDESQERHLRRVPTLLAKQRPKINHAIVALVGIATIVAAQLGLSVLLSEGAFQAAGLRSESVELARTSQGLSERVGVLNSPQNIALEAESLGMVSGQATSYLTLSSGAVAAGADALHMQQPATYRSGALLVPNSLVTPDATPAPGPTQAPVAPPAPGALLPATEAAIAAAAAPNAADGATYPGQLLPAEGVATPQR